MLGSGALQVKVSKYQSGEAEEERGESSTHGKATKGIAKGGGMEEKPSIYSAMESIGALWGGYT